MVSFARNLLSPTLFLSICFCCYLQSVIEHLITHLKLPLTLMKIYRIALGIHDDASATAVQPLTGHGQQSFTQQALLFIPTCWKHNNPSSSAAHGQVLKSGILTCVFMYRASIARQISLHHSTVWFKERASEWDFRCLVQVSSQPFPCRVVSPCASVFSSADWYQCCLRKILLCRDQKD